jgi:cytochrome c
MMKFTTTIAAATLLAGPAFAQASGDPAAGEEAFGQCVTCHVVEHEGEVLAGRNAQTGPNLYGVALRQYGVVEGFRYSDSMVEAGEAGNVWTEAAFQGYLPDPTGHLREVLDDRRARGKMTYRLRDEQEAVDIFAYLVSIGPELSEEEQAQLTGGEGS